MLVLGSNFDICYITSIFDTYGWSGWTERNEWGNPYTLLDVNSKKGADSPLYFLYSGLVLSGSLGNAGSYGYYWPSAAQSAADAYLLGFDSSSVGPSNVSNRYCGLSIRCVAR